VTDPHEGFADEQAYIAHMRHLEALRKQEAKARGVVKEKRRPLNSYSPRIQRALKNVKHRARVAMYLAEDPDGYRAKRREVHRHWLETHPSYNAEKCRHYYHKMRESFEFCEQYRQRNRAYWLANPEKHRAVNHAYDVRHREERATKARERRAKHAIQDQERRQTERAIKQAYDAAHYHQRREASRATERAYGMAYHAAHRDERNAKNRDYRWEHREELAATRRERRARKKAERAQAQGEEHA